MRILIAGASGVLGHELVDILASTEHELIALAHSEHACDDIKHKLSKIVVADVTRKETLKGICAKVDIVISVIGITRMKSKLSHMDLDYQGNCNLLDEALRAEVKRFVFLSPAGVELGFDYVPLYKAKRMFEEVLEASAIEYLIFRSGGFFRDYAQMAEYAKKGPLFIIGKGDSLSAPIDVRELAKIIVEKTLETDAQGVINVGGPENLSWLDVCKSCYDVLGKKPKLIYVPLWICKLTAQIIRPFSKSYFAMARLLIFTATVDLIPELRANLRFHDYLLNKYKKKES